MLYETHYFRKNLGAWQYLTPNHGIVFSAISENQLLPLNIIVSNVLSNKDNDLVKSKKEVQNLLSDLVKHKVVGEAVSEKIYRFTKSL